MWNIGSSSKSPLLDITPHSFHALRTYLGASSQDMLELQNRLNVQLHSDPTFAAHHLVQNDVPLVLREACFSACLKDIGTMQGFLARPEIRCTEREIESLLASTSHSNEGKALIIEYFLKLDKTGCIALQNIFGKLGKIDLYEELSERWDTLQKTKSIFQRSLDPKVKAHGRAGIFERRIAFKHEASGSLKLKKLNVSYDQT